ncbi:uncharacterized protein TNCV_3957351 [Trichonephila clavipes]|nr:uncharacterized protein TNCV_3957351 [Trichonephila clavipes]
MTGTLPPLLESVVGGGTPGSSFLRVYMDPMLLCQGKGLVLPNLHIDNVAKCSRFLILSLPNSEMSRKSPFAVHKAIIGIGGEPKSIKKLRSDFPLTVTPHRSLNSCRGVISEPDLLCSSETEILEGLSDQGVTQPNASPSVPSVSTSSSTTQANLLPSATSIKPTTQIQSWLLGPISASTPENSLNTSTSSLSTETCPAPTTSNKFAALQPSEPLLESATTSNSELSKTSKIPQNAKNRRKRTKAQKAEIEIKMAKHKPRKSGPTELTTDDEDMIMYDVQVEELEPDPEDKFAVMKCFVDNPSEYMRAITPT